jgi:drug/metabolite transporter (DMT)-like permease
MNSPKSQSLPKAPLGAGLVVLSSFFYASYGIWTKLMGNFFNGYTASTLRSVLVLVLLAPLAFTYRQIEPLNIRRNWGYITGMFVASLFTWGPLYYAILHAGVGISLAIAYASIVIGMFLFGRLFAGERFTKDKIISAVLGIIGLGLIFTPSTTTLGWLALMAALVSGVSSAANNVFAKRITYNATQSTLILWTVSVIASWSFVKGVKLIDAGAAGILGLLEIVFGVFFGVIFFHERPDVMAIVGIGVIIVAAAVPYVKDFNVTRGTLE